MPLRTAVLILGLLVAGSAPAGAREEEKKGAAPDRGTAIARALAYLSKHLPALPDTSGTPRKPFTQAAAGLAYLLAGDRTVAARDPVAAIRKDLLAFLADVERRSRDPKELPAAHGVADSRALCQYTWPLAQSALFFGELAKRGRHEEEAKAAIRRITALLTEARAENGGFGHGRVAPRKSEERDEGVPGLPEGLPIRGGYPGTLLAATNTVAGALGFVEGAFGPGAVDGLDLVREYYRTARLPNGNFPYDPSQRGAGRDDTGVSRTGGALFAMTALGFPASDPDVEGSLAFVRERLALAAEGHGSPCLNLLHTAFAFRLLGEKTWKEFRDEFHPRILAAAKEDGELPCICGKKAFGTTCDSEERFAGTPFERGQKVYTTTLNLLVLLLEEETPKLFGKPAKAPARTAVTPRGR